MKSNLTEQKSVPVPRRGKEFLIIGLMMLFAASVAAGMILSPGEYKRPVALADGSVITPPCYITIDGRKAALVESEEAAEQTLQAIIEEYRDSDATVLDIEIREETGIEEMNIGHGDEAPEILTVAEAKKKLMSGDDESADGSSLTVVTTEEEIQEETVAFDEEYRPDPEMYAGQTKVQVKGEDGVKEITKKVVRENGKPVKEEILDEEILEEPVEQIVLTGTKDYTGYGGGSGSNDNGVSYDENAVYETLRTPVDNVYISSGYGPRWGRLHRGTDFALAEGSPVHAADGGVVYCAGYSGSYGNIVKIDHGNGMQTYYAHCSSILVSDGEAVERGQKIALVGSTGNSTGPHLHFEVIVNGSCVDPVSLLAL
ncbi:MAG: peptidoglycan DD-metalloendopeptidase family protein [Bacillota bacterium]|nr:peptidoglycan DD-metalloendopeptidase family protein [Bacillota bacterium]